MKTLLWSVPNYRFSFYVFKNEKKEKIFLFLTENNIYKFNNEKEFLDFSIFKLLEDENIKEKFKTTLIDFGIIVENENIFQQQIDLYNMISY